MTVRKTSRPCYVCGKSDNPIVASEPAEYRFGIPLVPEGTYVFARCRACGTLYVDSEVDDAYLSKIYMDEAPESVLEATGGIEQSEMVAARLPEFQQDWSLVRRHRPVTPGDQLLDVGCQTGEFGTIAQLSGVQPHGVELSTRYAAMSRQRWGAGSVVHCGSLDTAPYREQQFQYVTAFETLEHMRDPILALQHMRRWVTDDGILAVSVPASDYFHLKFWLLRKAPLSSALRSAFAVKRPFYRRQILPHTHVYNFTPRSLRWVLSRGGFGMVRAIPTGWHGSAGEALRAASTLLFRASGARITFAPSILAIAHPLPR